MIYIRVEASSAVPIYRQIMDQIRFAIVSGTLKEKQRMPSVRELAGQLAVNQNTVLKVYNQLCLENVLEVDRGNGTFVAAGAVKGDLAVRRGIVTKSLGEAVVQALQLGVEKKEVHELLDREYRRIRDAGIFGEK